MSNETGIPGQQPMMPIQEHSREKKFKGGIPMALLNEEWARRNHGQTLKRLAERGGLSASEAVAIIEQRPFSALLDERAKEILAEMVLRFSAPTK